MAAYEILLLNTTIPQIQAAQSGDTYVVPRDIAFSAALTLSAGTANGVPYLNGSKVVTTGSALTFDGANLGIGATSPTQPLSITRGASVAAYIDVAGGGRTLGTTSFTFGQASDGVVVFFQRENAAMYWATNSTERMRLDSSGNLGLGVTPSAWGANNKTLEFAAGGVSAFTTAAMEYAQNSFFNGSNWIYKTSAAAERYTQFSGEHRWYNAASGTAGNTISFTQAMTLDASGRLGIGPTNPTYTLDVTGSTSTARLGKLTITNDTPFVTGANLDAGSNSFALGTSGAGIVTFFSNNTERARITSGGEFLVGTTTTGVGNAAGVGIGYNSGASYQSIGHANGTSSGAVYISFGYNAGAIGNITQNGTTGVLYNITSDYRLKNVVGAVTGAGARIDALKPVDYTWKTDGSAARGFLAHEFQEIYPNSVIGTKDAVDEEGKPIHQQMQASTSEVIADLVAELQSLRARVAQLEGK